MLIEAVYAFAILALAFFGAHLFVLTVLAGRGERLAEGPVPDPGMEREPAASLPCVTVQVPVFNEKFVVEDVIDACVRLEYPKTRIEIQILDDSTDETSTIAARHIARWRQRGVDIHHVRRNDRQGFKAGALQNGLNIASGDFLAIFDADFLPDSDFLLRLMPAFENPRTGFVQARWGHLNCNDSILTRIQAASLDAHFMIEQRARSLAGCFINFNGTCGIWRREAILDAGGWSGDTITEDLDLSYRAQIKGWQGAFFPEVEVRGQLPQDINALRSQQFRWTKGSIEAALKCLVPLWRSAAGKRRKVEASIHLLANLAFPLILLAAVLHAPVLLSVAHGAGPGPVYLVLLGAGLAGLAGILASQFAAQHWLYPRWSRSLKMIPSFLAGTMGLSINNTIAVMEALAGRRTPFLRTPKGERLQPETGRAYPSRRYRPASAGLLPYAEIMVGMYCGAGAVLLASNGMIGALPFQLLFAAGFLLTGLTSLAQRRTNRRLHVQIDVALMPAAGKPLH